MGNYKQYGGVMNTITYPFFFLEAGPDVESDERLCNRFQEWYLQQLAG